LDGNLVAIRVGREGGGIGKSPRVKEHQEEMSLYIATIEANTMTETILVSSPSIEISQEKLGDFENHTRDIDSNLLMHIC
jgi:hypothetical protein